VESGRYLYMLGGVEGDLLIVGGFAFLHLSGTAGYCGSLAETAWPAPRQIVLSKSHLLGVAALIIGVFVIIGSAHTGLLNYGIFVGTALGIADAWLIYKACVRWLRSRPSDS
jgi:hypothetical protein